MAFETAVLALERAEHAATIGEPVDESELLAAHKTFGRLQAEPWLARSERLSAALSVRP